MTNPNKKLLQQALAYVRWTAFGECRTPGWDGPPPTSAEIVAALEAAIAQPAPQPLQMQPMESENGTKGWYIDGPDFYCDIDRKPGEPYSVFIRHKDGTEGFAQLAQTEQLTGDQLRKIVRSVRLSASDPVSPAEYVMAGFSFAIAQPIEPNNDEVICPTCCHQFRAIPTNVQRLMLDAGFEPPFTKPVQPAAQRAPVLPPLGPHDHPEPWIMKWTELEMQFIREYALAAIAATKATP